MTATNSRAAVIAAVVGAAASRTARPGHAACCPRNTDGALRLAVDCPLHSDPCPMGGVHDPADSDRPCERCGASPR